MVASLKSAAVKDAHALNGAASLLMTKENTAASLAKDTDVVGEGY